MNSKAISILDKDYKQWVATLGKRFRQSQIKAAVSVNSEMLRFYWELGRDIVEMQAEQRWGDKLVRNLSRDLQNEIPDSCGLTIRNIYYCKKFYSTYNQLFTNVPQVVAQFRQQKLSQVEAELFAIPWGHHRYILDKCENDPQKGLFYVRQTLENGWSRAVLLNWMDSGLYERQGKALTNFKVTLPDASSDLAQEITKDPYNFAFAGVTGRYNERRMKDALLHNKGVSVADRRNGEFYRLAVLQPATSLLCGNRSEDRQIRFL